MFCFFEHPNIKISEEGSAIVRLQRLHANIREFQQHINCLSNFLEFMINLGENINSPELEVRIDSLIRDSIKENKHLVEFKRSVQVIEANLMAEQFNELGDSLYSYAKK